MIKMLGKVCDWRGMMLVGFLLLVTTIAGAQNEKDYGAEKANSRFASGANSEEGSSPNYLALHDASGPSGVPLGGIGVGAVDLAPDGHFTRFAINNWSTDGVDMARRDNPAWDQEAFLAPLGEGCFGNHRDASSAARSADARRYAGLRAQHLPRSISYGYAEL